MEWQHARNLRAVYFFGGGPRLEIELTVPSCPVLQQVRRWSGPKIDRAERMHDYMYFYLNANMDDHHHRVRIFRNGQLAVSPNLNARGTFVPPEPIKKQPLPSGKITAHRGGGRSPGRC